MAASQTYPTQRPAGQMAEACQVCGAPLGDTVLRCREMMYGTREEFNYRVCTACGCMQIETVPADIARHYPQDYYSFNPDYKSFRGFFGSKTFIAFRRVFTNWLVKPGGIVRPFARSLRRGPILPRWLNDVVKPVTTSTRILDVGCGGGGGLIHLRNCGFTDLTGVDPYIREPITYPDNIIIHKCGVEELKEKYDLVMLHHVYEHLADPVGVMRKLAALVRPGGQIVIRIPLADSHAARHYGVHWAQLDAPRHFFLHTRKSMQIIADKAGLKVANVVYDSREFQFWASEQYAKDIPLNSPKTGSLVSREQLKAYRRLARELNRQHKGDSACFVLTQPD